MKYLFTLLLTVLTLSASAQTEQPQALPAPELEFALQLKVTLDGTFSIIAYAQVRLNEIPLAPNLWVPLPNFSVILINDEIQLNFRIDKP